MLNNIVLIKIKKPLTAFGLVVFVQIVNLQIKFKKKKTTHQTPLFSQT